MSETKQAKPAQATAKIAAARAALADGAARKIGAPIVAGEGRDFHEDLTRALDRLLDARKGGAR